MSFTEIIQRNNLFPQNIKAYVQPFTDGSDFFWNKEITFTQFINDSQHRLNDFFKRIRENKKLTKKSIYFQHQPYTTNIDEICNSNFLNRLKGTYLFDRTYDRTILSTDSKDTFYFCPIVPDQKILDDFFKVQGKVLFIFDKKDINIKDYKCIIDDGKMCLFNYENIKHYDLFNLD